MDSATHEKLTEPATNDQDESVGGREID